MIMLPALAGRSLRWRHTSLFSSVYELCLGDEVAGRLLGPEKLFGRVHRAEGFGGAWEFESQGFFERVIAVREPGKELPFAKLTGTAWKGFQAVELAKGERWELRHNMWKGMYEVSTKGTTVMTSRGLFSLTWLAEVVIPASVAHLERAPWLPMVIFMLQLQQRRQAAHAG